MRLQTLAPIGLTLSLAACGGSLNQGIDFGQDDTGDTGLTSDGGSSDGGSSDGGSSDGGSSDGGSSDGGSGDGGDTGPDYCHNDYHPLHETGWTKTYAATFTFLGTAGGEGTATETSYGRVTLPDGTEGYAYQDSVSIPSGESYDVTTYVACDPTGDEGMFVIAWEGTYDMSLLGAPMSYAVDATLSPGRKYLPPQYALGSVGSWSYSYSLDVVATSTGKATDYPSTTSGSYAEAGMQSITLFNGETVTAYKLVNSYTQVAQTGTTNGYIEQYWVKGLGLVRENHINMDTGAQIASKELSSYSGLTIDR